MTDISGLASSVPSRLGVMARYHDGELVLELAPPAETRHHGIVRASVLAFMIDAVAGIPMDQDAEAWTLTSDMTVRMRPIPAPARIDATTTTVRQSSRSATSMVELVTEAGAPIAVGAIGFVKVRRKETDPPKPVLPPGQAPMVLRRPGALTRPLREEAGIEVVDAAEGVVHVEV
ncbi:MAG: PaaI family thioesterase, partial [Acidimicrobiales bacterium]